MDFHLWESAAQSVPQETVEVGMSALWEPSMAIIVSIIVLMVTIANLYTTGVLKAALMKGQLDNATLKDELVRVMDARDKLLADKMDRIASSYGEVVTGIRAHINVEVAKLYTEINGVSLHMRDNYVRRDVFTDVIIETRRAVSDGLKAVQVDISRLEDVVMDRSK